MGLLNIFDKKICSICGNEIKFLGNRKLADGNMCKNCESKLSPLFSERRQSTALSVIRRPPEVELFRPDHLVSPVFVTKSFKYIK